MDIALHAGEFSSSLFLREHVIRKVRSALGRLESKVRWVRVFLSDENGPRGGIDTCCRITVALEPGGRVVQYEGRGDSTWSAVARACRSLQYITARAVKRRTRKGRHRRGEWLPEIA